MSKADTNKRPELRELRQAGPELRELRQAGPELRELRQAGPALAYSGGRQISC